MDVIKFLRVFASPCAAQPDKSGGESSRSGNFNVSIICPSTASASTIAGFRYFTDNSNAFIVRSHISCTFPGASTMHE
jgi:hypothetical protein